MLEGPQSARRDDDEHSDDEDGAGVDGSSAAAPVDTGCSSAGGAGLEAGTQSAFMRKSD